MALEPWAASEEVAFRGPGTVLNHFFVIDIVLTHLLWANSPYWAEGAGLRSQFTNF